MSHVPRQMFPFIAALLFLFPSSFVPQPRNPQAVGIIEASVGGHLNALGFTPNATVTVEVFNEEGGPVIFGPETLVTDAEGNAGMDPADPLALKPGNYIVVTDDPSGQTAEMVVANVHVYITDADKDVIAGIAPAGETIEVFAGTEEQGGMTQMVTADANGVWIADFSAALDITTEMKVEAILTNTENHRTVSSRGIISPRIAANLPNNVSVYGFFPEASMTFELYDSSGGTLLFGPESVPIDAMGNASLQLPLYLEPGSHIVAQDETSGLVDTLTVEQVHIDVIDTALDQVYGRSEPNAEVKVFAGTEERGGMEQFVIADAGGSWAADFSGKFDITEDPGMKSEAAIETDDADATVAVQLVGSGTTVGPDASASLTYTIVPSSTNTISLPAGSVTDTTKLFYMPSSDAPGFPTGTSKVGVADRVDAVTVLQQRILARRAYRLVALRNDEVLRNLKLTLPATSTMEYRDDEVLLVDEDKLQLMYWNEGSGEWIDAVNTCETPGEYERDPSSNRVTVPFCRLGNFVLVGPEEHRLHLPVLFH